MASLQNLGQLYIIFIVSKLKLGKYQIQLENVKNLVQIKVACLILISVPLPTKGAKSEITPLSRKFEFPSQNSKQLIQIFC